MKTTLPCVALLAACILSILSGCAKKDPPARPGDMAPRPLAVATPQPTSMPADTKLTGRVVAAGMIQVYKRFVTIEDVMTGGQGGFERIDGTLDEAEFRKLAAPVVADETARVIQSTIALGAAERELTDNQKANIEANVDYAKAELITKAGGSLERLKQDLADDGLNLEDLLENHRRQLTITLYHRNKFMPSIVITRKMMWNYYQSHRKDYEVTRTVQLRVIAVPPAALIKPDVAKPSEGDITAARSEARKIVRNAAKTIAAGESFEAAARRIGKAIQNRYGEKWHDVYFKGKSGVTRMIKEGGLWPKMSPNSGVRHKVLARAVVELEQGHVSAVEETDDCCYLVKAALVIKARNDTFEDAQEGIEQRLRQKEYSRRRSLYMREILREFQQMQQVETPRMARFQEIVLDHVVAEYHGKPAEGPVAPQPTTAPAKATTTGT